MWSINCWVWIRFCRLHLMWNKFICCGWAPQKVECHATRVDPHAKHQWSHFFMQFRLVSVLYFGTKLAQLFFLFWDILEAFKKNAPLYHSCRREISQNPTLKFLQEIPSSLGRSSVVWMSEQHTKETHFTILQNRSTELRHIGNPTLNYLASHSFIFILFPFCPHLSAESFKSPDDGPTR